MSDDPAGQHSHSVQLAWPFFSRASRERRRTRTRVAGEFVILFRDDMDDEFFDDEFAAGDTRLYLRFITRPAVGLDANWPDSPLSLPDGTIGVPVLRRSGAEHSARRKARICQFSQGARMESPAQSQRTPVADAKFASDSGRNILNECKQPAVWTGSFSSRMP